MSVNTRRKSYSFLKTAMFIAALALYGYVFHIVAMYMYHSSEVNEIPDCDTSCVAADQDLIVGHGYEMHLLQLNPLEEKKLPGSKLSGSVFCQIDMYDDESIFFSKKQYVEKGAHDGKGAQGHWAYTINVKNLRNGEEQKLVDGMCGLLERKANRLFFYRYGDTTNTHAGLHVLDLGVEGAQSKYIDEVFPELNRYLPHPPVQIRDGSVVYVNAAKELMGYTPETGKTRKLGMTGYQVYGYRPQKDQLILRKIGGALTSDPVVLYNAGNGDRSREFDILKEHFYDLVAYLPHSDALVYKQAAGKIYTNGLYDISTGQRRHMPLSYSSVPWFEWACEIPAGTFGN